MAIRRASVEIWQTILRYSISVPIFFDEDPLNTYSLGEFIRLYTEEDNYWRSERTRNRLRRVCTSWNGYLKHFDHRFVKLADVANGHIPPSAVCRATRLELEPRGGGSNVAQFLSLAIQEGSSEWKLEILDRPVDAAHLSESWRRRVTNLKVIIDDRCGISSELFVEFSSQLTLASYLTTSPNLTSTISLPNLTTLAIDVPYSQIYHDLHLPSLRHLSMFPPNMTPEDLINILQAIGKGLTTLLAMSESDGHLTFPDEAWLLCPRLEVIQTSFLWDPAVSFPKSLRLLRVYPQYPELVSVSRLPVVAILAAGMRSVSIAKRWYNVFYQDPEHLDYVKIAMDYGLAIFDEEDISFHEFIVHLLSFYWKKRRLSWNPIFKIATSSIF